MPSKDRRKFGRYRRRFACQLEVEGRVRRAFVCDVSPTGLFVELAGAAPPLPAGQAVHVVLDVGRRAPAITIETVVARTKRSHRAVSSVDLPGIGLSIVSAPETYYQLLQQIKEDERSS